MQEYIYIVFSTTHNRIGKAIRKITRETYNHVSIALDRDLNEMYSFARRYYRTPFYGGFVKEYSKRFIVNDQTANIAICRIPVTPQQHRTLCELLSGMYQDKDNYLYNHISAFCALFHKTVEAKDAYTCLEFCLSVLRMVDQPFEKNQYYSICDVWNYYKENCIYTGPMPETDEADTSFYLRRPVPHPISVTVRDICKLLPRIRQSRQST